MRLRTLLHVEVAPTKVQPCGAGRAAEMGAFSSIGALHQSVVFDSTRIRDMCSGPTPCAAVPPHV